MEAAKIKRYLLITNNGDEYYRNDGESIRGKDEDIQKLELSVRISSAALHNGKKVHIPRTLADKHCSAYTYVYVCVLTKCTVHSTGTNTNTHTLQKIINTPSVCPTIVK